MQHVHLQRKRPAADRPDLLGKSLPGRLVAQAKRESAPASAQASAQARPRPRAAAVTSTVCPLRSKLGKHSAMEVPPG
jgi:hypothetical protein